MSLTISPSPISSDFDFDVSIIMAAYNSERFIAEAINSCLAQTGITFEIIVCDDGSDRRLKPFIEEITQHDPRVTTLTSERNEGPACARNRALSVARGEFIAIVDSDDFVTPSRIAKLIEAGRRTGADILVDNLIEFSLSSGKRREVVFLTGPEMQRERSISLTDYMRSGRKKRSSLCFGHLKPVIRTSTLREGAFSYRESVRISEDYYLLADMLRNGASMLYVPQTAYYYRRHPGSMTYRADAEHFKMILDEEQAFRRAPLPPLSPEQLNCSHHRSRTFRKMYAFEKMANDVKRHRYLDALWTFTKHPVDMPFQVSRVIVLLLRKMRRA